MAISERGPRNRARLRLCASAVFLMLLMGCTHKNNLKDYPLEGLVVGKNELTRELIVKHDDIPGFMPAMTMPYTVKDAGSFSRVEPGDTVAATLVVAKASGDFWLENLTILDSSKRGQALETSAPEAALPGSAVPDIPLLNQAGKIIHFSQFKGKALLITFIYTRCPFPNFCPLVSSHFAAIHRELEKQPEMYRKTHLLSISFDPNYDKPPVLRKYGLAYMDGPSGFAQWDFAAPAPADLHKLAQAFGLYYVQNGNQIAHSMDTVLISPNRTIVNSWTDNLWQVKDVLAALVKEAGIGQAAEEKGK
jgi:protein SCO1